MMFMLTLLLATVLDVFPSAVPTGGMEQQFFVSTITESAWAGCAMSPQSGMADAHGPLSLDWTELPESVADEHSSWALPVLNTEPGGIAPMLFALPGDPPPLPPPAAAVPEPSTYAILGISAALLLFLLFGRRRLAH